MGGVVTGIFGLRNERSRQAHVASLARQERERADHLRLTAARGVAREMRALLRRNLLVIEATVQIEAWWDDRHLRLETFDREEARTLLATLLTTDQWAAVEHAEYTQALIETQRRFNVGIASDRLDGLDADPRHRSPLTFVETGDPDAAEDAHTALEILTKRTDAAIAALTAYCDETPQTARADPAST